MSTLMLFVVVWVVVVLLAIALDWLGNRSRGRFWPTADRVHGLAGGFRLRRRRRRDRADMVRRTLQATYGRTTLRLFRRTPRTVSDAVAARPVPHQPLTIGMDAGAEEPARQATGDPDPRTTDDAGADEQARREPPDPDPRTTDDVDELPLADAS